MTKLEEFCEKYGIGIQQVINVKDQAYNSAEWQEWYGDKEAGRCIHSGKYDGLGYKAAVDAMTGGKVGKQTAADGTVTVTFAASFAGPLGKSS